MHPYTRVSHPQPSLTCLSKTGPTKERKTDMSVQVYDTETIGFVPDKAKVGDGDSRWDDCRLVELAWKVYQPTPWTLVASGDSIVQPVGFEVPAQASAVLGITTARAKSEGQPLQQVLDRLFEDIKTHNVTTIVAHKVDFDRAVIGAELHRAGDTARLKEWHKLKKFCTMSATKGTLRWGYKLSEAYEMHVGPLPPDCRLHSATTDTQLCADLYHKLIGPSTRAENGDNRGIGKSGFYVSGERPEAVLRDARPVSRGRKQRLWSDYRTRRHW